MVTTSLVLTCKIASFSRYHPLSTSLVSPNENTVLFSIFRQTSDWETRPISCTCSNTTSSRTLRSARWPRPAFVSSNLIVTQLTSHLCSLFKSKWRASLIAVQLFKCSPSLVCFGSFHSCTELGVTPEYFISHDYLTWRWRVSLTLQHAHCRFAIVIGQKELAMLSSIRPILQCPVRILAQRIN